jgi:hypothetical protein
MIDCVTLLLINMVSALVALAFFLWWGLGREDTRHWAPAFGISGLVATGAGFLLTGLGGVCAWVVLWKLASGICASARGPAAS